MHGTPISRDKLLWHPDKLAQLKSTGKTIAPVNVEIDLSNRCSLGCEWCHFAYTHTRGPLKGKREKPAGAVLGGDLMDERLIRSMLDDLEESGVKSITWTGGGEPTLHPWFDEATRYAMPMSQGLYTHGGHIDAERAANLKSRLTFVYVSLDALDATSYSRAKGVGPKRFDAACEGISRLVSARGKATIGVGFLLTEKNWHQARAMAQLASELGADYAQFRPTILYDMETPSVPSEDTGWMDEPLREQLDGLAANTKVSIDVERFRQYRYWKGHGYDTCWWSMFQTCITPNGKVWACVNKREHPSAEIGDLTVETFSEIWHRHTAAKVTGDCRVMCRGHLANQTLDALMQPTPHEEFV